MSQVTLALAQMSGQALEPERNRAMTVSIIREVAAQGAKLVILPELIIPGYVMDPEGLARCAEPVDGPTYTAWHALAREYDLHICGGICERAGGRLYNSAILIGPEGLALHYRKLHLFADEKDSFAAGDRGLPIADTALGRIGVCVCYDLRFVEVVRSFALRGAQLIAVPTAWVTGFDREPWDNAGWCPQARAAAVQANLSQIFIACASQVGAGKGTRFLGSSVLISPYGEALIGPLSGQVPQVAQTTIDLGAVAAAQQRTARVSPRADRRTDVYGLWIEGQRL
jgi:predicted amidohydrolase